MGGGDEQARSRALAALGVALPLAAGLVFVRVWRRRPPGSAKAITVRKPRAEVEAAWRGARIATTASVTFRDAPGDRGTEIAVRATSARASTRLADELRRLKQVLETGEVQRSDAVPAGHALRHQLRQRPAQPLARSTS